VQLSLSTLPQVHHLGGGRIIGVVESDHVGNIMAPVDQSLRDILDPGEVFSEKYIFVQKEASTFSEKDETDELLFDVEGMVLEVGRVTGLVSAVPKVGEDEAKLLLIPVSNYLVPIFRSNHKEFPSLL
jgi:hypothetical protein